VPWIVGSHTTWIFGVEFAWNQRQSRWMKPVRLNFSHFGDDIHEESGLQRKCCRWITLDEVAQIEYCRPICRATIQISIQEFFQSCVVNFSRRPSRNKFPVGVAPAPEACAIQLSRMIESGLVVAAAAGAGAGAGAGAAATIDAG
jgi:hypothetical protein